MFEIFSSDLGASPTAAIQPSLVKDTNRKGRFFYYYMTTTMTSTSTSTSTSSSYTGTTKTLYECQHYEIFNKMKFDLKAHSRSNKVNLIIQITTFLR